VHSWVEEQIILIIEKHYQEGMFPKHLIQEMGKMGFLGVKLGANLGEYKCPSLNNMAYKLICQDLEWGDSTVQLFTLIQGLLVMFPIHAYSIEEQK
jgi:glutaryl-CoA dehydrogenase